MVFSSDGKVMIDLEQLKIVRLTAQEQLQPFDCEDADLNGFLSDDALNYRTERMAVTYLLIYQHKIAAYFCLLNDKVTFETNDSSGKSFWNRFNRYNKIPNSKRRKNYPATKIGRLAVSKDAAGNGIGRFIITGVKDFLSEKEDVACRFLTVDAYSTAFDFYLKNGFSFISEKDENDATRLMYFDLKRQQEYPKP
jgi:predicted GNAT family N-acyltransferase